MTASSTPPILVVDLPTLRLDWIDAEMPRLAAIARDWRRAEIDPVFPALTCPSQATLTTGAAPAEHGVVANGLFDRSTGRPEFWVFHDDRVRATRVWEKLQASGRRAGVFFLLNTFGAEPTALLLPKPIHHPDGRTELWCHHRPDGLYPKLVETMGHFDLTRFWGPLAGIESSRWIAEAARRTIAEMQLDLSFVYLPHTDYAPQKFGPDSDPARAAHRELDGVLAELIEATAEARPNARFVVVSEYAMTDVNRVVFPNRILRELGKIDLSLADGREWLNYGDSAAFAMVDHQIAHVYCARRDVAALHERFESEPAIERVADPREVGLAHANSGELILIARPDAWFAYPWWIESEAAPPFAATVDIHNKPGYDPLEMFWDPAARGIARDPALVRGSHGAPGGRASLLSNLDGIEAADSTAAVARAIEAALV
jgi:predicted AlkP superfamily pyrophosphatase or phosphodiesterase